MTTEQQRKKLSSSEWIAHNFQRFSSHLSIFSPVYVIYRTIYTFFSFSIAIKRCTNGKKQTVCVTCRTVKVQLVLMLTHPSILMPSVSRKWNLCVKRKLPLWWNEARKKRNTCRHSQIHGLDGCSRK